jgi:hypothetical protein
MTTTPSIDSTDVTVTRYAATNLLELLAHCEEFLRTASPAVRAELRAFLDRQPTAPDAGWLIDMLGFNTLYLQGKLATAAAANRAAHTRQDGDLS